MQNNNITLADKYTVDKSRIMLSGTQALIRLPLMQKAMDKDQGLNTAGFISGYRGSPLGNYDSALWGAQEFLKEHQITFQPGVNEDLAATAVWGTQQLSQFDHPDVDGVFGIWYGKGPGVDRSGDVLKHANYSGTHPNGGALVVFGDDHPGKSSTIAHQSEQALAANSIPVLYPASVEEIIEYGLHGFALSRYSGLWIGLKTVNETVEQTATVNSEAPTFVLPDANTDTPSVHFEKGVFNPQADEIKVYQFRIPRVHQYVKANMLDKEVLRSSVRRLGLVTAGKAYNDVMEALLLLGIDAARAEALGISVYKVGCIWPLEPSGIKQFSRDMETLFFIEEKKAFLEDQAAKLLYNEPARPAIIGKTDKQGNTLLASDIQLEPVSLACRIAELLIDSGCEDRQLISRLKQLTSKVESSLPTPQKLMRLPLFCSGCPHNTSTNLPDGSVAGSGIGCHGMAFYHRDDMLSFTHMGAEGAQWAGLAPYVSTPHIFQNMGDGTYFHSGLLAIRSAVAAKSNITYKILYNDAVAMTGGQPIDGPISVATIAHQVLHEGVASCVIVSDDPRKHQHNRNMPSGVRIHHRDELDVVQRQLRETNGCTILIYEQTCATEKRRRRKRGTYPDPDKRLFIYDKVCEGCGDCTEQSKCVSIEPLETELGRKRTLDQSSCNKDFSCVKGFCPSFVSVYGGKIRKSTAIHGASPLTQELPEARTASIPPGGFNIMITGIGGTGVVTVGALLGMAAHIEGKSASIYDMTGLAQKGGSVNSHLRIGTPDTPLYAQRISVASADLVMGFDLVGVMARDVVQTLEKDRTHIIGNIDLKPTAQFIKQPDIAFECSPITEQLEDKVGKHRCHFIEATNLATILFGNSIATNLFMVGYAKQLGLLPLSDTAIIQAIRLNGTAVEFNIEAFSMGRLLAVAPEKVVGKPTPEEETAPASLDDIVSSRAKLLTEYQNEKYAQRYTDLITALKNTEAKTVINSDQLAINAAKSFAKLLAYKDEYEIARLYSDPSFVNDIDRQFDGNYKLSFNLAPPLFARKDKATGLPRKSEYSYRIITVFKVLRKLKSLRGTAFDLFGYTHERKTERKLIREYEQLMLRVNASLSSENYSTAVAIAELPMMIKGFGHVKLRNIKRYEQEKSKLEKKFAQL